MIWDVFLFRMYPKFAISKIWGPFEGLFVSQMTCFCDLGCMGLPFVSYKPDFSGIAIFLKTGLIPAHHLFERVKISLSK